MRYHLIFNEYNKNKKLQIQRHVELQAVILIRQKAFMFVISNTVFMRCVLINAIINADTNRWHVLLYNVLWLYLFIMSISENKNALKLGMACLVLIYCNLNFFVYLKLRNKRKCIETRNKIKNETKPYLINKGFAFLMICADIIYRSH